MANSGTIKGGVGGFGATTPGPAGDAIYSAGTSASIGPITNSGQMIGNVEIDNQASVTIHGGTGKTFGSWMSGPITSGAITVGNGSLIFASGNTEVFENISVNGGVGTVTNSSVLRFGALEVINGNVRNNGTVQVSVGKLEIESAVTGKGTDTVSKTAKLEFDARVSTATTLGDQDIIVHSAMLALVDPTGFYGKISDFGSSDTVKLEGFWAFSALSHGGGDTTLTLAQGATRHDFPVRRRLLTERVPHHSREDHDHHIVPERCSLRASLDGLFPWAARFGFPTGLNRWPQLNFHYRYVLSRDRKK
jgi:hypothetical protein